VNSVIDGRPISGPAYPAWADDAEGEARDQGVVAIPSERLADCPEGRTILRRQNRLVIASRFYAACIAARPDVIDRAPSRTHGQCLEHADQLIAANERFDTSPREPVPPPPLPTDLVSAVTLLLWLADHGPMPAGERPPGLSDSQAGNARWQVRKAGLAEYDAGLRLALTAAGWKAIGRTALTAV
jgi:hypothetical protein